MHGTARHFRIQNLYRRGAHTFWSRRTFNIKAKMPSAVAEVTSVSAIVSVSTFAWEEEGTMQVKIITKTSVQNNIMIRAFNSGVKIFTNTFSKPAM